MQKAESGTLLISSASKVVVVANGEQSRGWWSDHVVDVIIMILTVVGLWVAYEIPIALNHQDSAEHLKEERSARFEADVAEINKLVAGVLGEEGSEHLAAKRSAARAASEYAQQGRVYTPATSILFHYLEKENDARTHCYLHAAIDRGLAVKPPALGAGAHSEEGSDLDEKKWTALTKVERVRLVSLTRVTDTVDCSDVTETPPPIVQQSKISDFSQYLDVDCSKVNNGSLRVPIDNTLTSRYKVQSATATIQDISNLKESHVDVIGTEPDAALVKYSIVGLDRQIFGNCPGGGHGTLVVRFQLTTK